MTSKRPKSGMTFLGIQVDKWLLTIVIGVFLYFAYQEGVLYEIVAEIIGKEKKVVVIKDKEENEIITDEDVPIEFPARLSTCQIVRHRYYALCYDEIHEQPAWVAYKLDYKETQGNASRDDDVFKPDNQVSTGSALPTDYAGTGYDRGHLAPAADFRFSEQAMSETFYMSNMSPQVPDFNRGIWKELEQRVRTWIKKEKTLYIVSGGILTSGLKRIGKRTRISVPNYFYKIILDLQEPEKKAIAFLMKNEGSNAALQTFVVSIDEIEALTGIDFFPQLPDEIEDKLEKSISTNKWFKSRR